MGVCTHQFNSVSFELLVKCDRLKVYLKFLLLATTLVRYLSILKPTILPIVFKLSQLFKSCTLVSIALVASVDVASAAPATPAQAAAYAKPIFAAGFNKT